MEITEFFFFVLPLGVIIVILASLAIYLARKEEIMHHSELETLNELLILGLIDPRNVMSTLPYLLESKIIDLNTFERLGKLLEAVSKEGDSFKHTNYT